MQNIIQDFSNRDISFQAAHITDIHIKDLVPLVATAFVARFAAFKTKLLGHTIDYLLNTGDTADGQLTTSDLKVEQFVADMAAFKPMYNTRGNHDGSVTNAQLGMPVDNWYSAEINAKWKIIVLYSQGGGNYSLGATQTTWLSAELAATPSTQYVCIMSHVPILCVAAMMWYHRNGQAWVDTVDFHSDSKDIIDIIKAYPNVKVCLSGHEHTIDRVDHEGVVYLNSGAVSANWWGDNTFMEKQYPAGYRLIDFYEDGGIREKFITY